MSDNIETTEHEELTAEQLQAQQDAEQMARDAEAARLASSLGADETEEDFDPTGAMDNMSPEQEQAAMVAAQEMLTTPEGAEMAASGAIDWYEELVQEHGHERFTIPPKKKEIGAKRLTPVVQKYAPQVLGLFGQYKNEIMAALWVGSMAYGSVKQVRALKAQDLAAKKQAEAASQDAVPEQQEAA